MHKRLIWLSVIILVILGIGFFVFGGLDKRSESLASPWSGLGGIGNNLWLPKIASSKADHLNISAKAAYFVEMNSGDVLYQKNEHLRLPAASLVKIMTMIVALENRDWKESFAVSQRASDMEPDKMLLIAGEKLSLEELLDGIILVSANDAAEVLAENTFFDREKFIKMMNQKALMLGMGDSKFINPSGLAEDGLDQFSTAYDVALMSRYAIKNFPHLVDISSTYHIYLAQSPTHQDYDMYSGINLLTTYPGVIGFKTGFTPEAGLTLVTVAKREGKMVLGVLLGSEDRRGEARELLDYSFKKLGLRS